MGSFKTYAVAVSISLFAAAPASAESVTEFLRAFHADPVRTMERLPSEVINGEARPRGFIDEKRVAEQIPFRSEMRDQVTESGRPFLPGLQWDPSDSYQNPASLVEPGTAMVMDLFAMDAQRLTRASVSETPWWDSYWPFYAGGLGRRYADPSWPEQKNWLASFEYVTSRPASAILAYGDPQAIDRLSPAEKYDFVMGDANFTLTQHAWRQGKGYYEKHGAVPTWMGICHGWAGASHMQVPIPQEPVKVTAANGTAVTFYPQDIKALTSLLWANQKNLRSRYVGRRCDVPGPERDAYGRIVDPICWDANPAAWHLTVVNQIGQNRRSLVMDATYDTEVWNHPLTDYSYRYFNPETWQETANLRAAIVPIERYKLDKFRAHRAPEARYVVGVYMDVTYAVEPQPSRQNFETPKKTLRFIYDLELDANYQVIGGEWYSNAHPDFLWTYDRGAQALSKVDGEVTDQSWTPAVPVPADWGTLSERASAAGTPLQAFLQGLSAAPKAE